MKKNILSDYHVHPNYSIDAHQDASIDNYCKKAISLHINQICFTTHLELDSAFSKTDGFVIIKGNRVPVTDNWFNTYENEISYAKFTYKNKLKILCGLEVSYESDFENTIRNNLKKYACALDFILGAVHAIKHKSIDTEKHTPVSLGKRNFKEMCEIYFGTILKASESKLFSAIAHLDLYKWYGIRFYAKETFKLYKNIMGPCFESFSKNNVALEINTAALRKGFKEPYPSIKLLQFARECGVKYVTIGSDCHRLEHLGYRIEEVIFLAKKLGFKIFH